MAVKKQATRTTKKSKSTIDFTNISSNISSKSSSKTKKLVKKISLTTFLILVIFVTIGSVGGWFAISYLTKNDCFDLIGEDTIELEVGDIYTDEGVKIVAFGKDVSDEIQIESDLKKISSSTYTATEAGTYYIIYKSENIRYNSLYKVQRVRLLIFIENGESGD